MSINISVHVSEVDDVNARLEEMGFGRDNIDKPARDGDDAATHAVAHAFDVPGLLEALEQLKLEFPSLHVSSDPGIKPKTATTYLTARSLEGYDPTTWPTDPIMTGDQRTYDGKTWESLTDYNVWLPPVGWREVGVEYPEWQQPTGAHDAYNMGDGVTYNGTRYTSLIDANVWSPAAYPAGWQEVV